VAVDHQTLEDDTVTIRERDTMAQVRVKIDALKKEIGKRVSMKNILKEVR
jgi:glycyl-tRNA synthetase